MPSTLRCLTRRDALAATGGVAVSAVAGCVSTIAAPSQQQWRYAPEDDDVTGLAVNEEVVILATRDAVGEPGRLHAVERGTGDRRWRITVPSPRSPPVLHDAIVAVGTADGVVGVDTDTGKRRWRALQGRDTVVRHLGTTTAIIAATTGSGAVVGLGTDGTIQWRVTADVVGDAPVTTGPNLIGITGPSEPTGSALAFRTLEPESGSTMWEQSVPGGLPADFTVDAETVFAAGGDVRAWRVSDGQKRWAFNPGVREVPTTRPVVGPERRIYVGTGVRFSRDYGSVFQINTPEGVVGYEHRADTTVTALAGATDVLFAQAAERLVALSYETLASRWSVSRDHTMLATHGQVCYAIDDTGRLVAYSDTSQRDVEASVLSG